jgi:enamine deaminase RidA (YjgF/YER057c/UK114 family)
MPARTHSRSGSPFEQMAAYSRAVRVGTFIATSATAATGDDGKALAPGDTYGQTAESLQRALAAVSELGGEAADVIRSRLLLTRDADWREAIRAHAETFAGIDPANTTHYVEGFIPDGVLVEVELDAVVADPNGRK